MLWHSLPTDIGAWSRVVHRTSGLSYVTMIKNASYLQKTAGSCFPLYDGRKGGYSKIVSFCALRWTIDYGVDQGLETSIHVHTFHPRLQFNTIRGAILYDFANYLWISLLCEIMYFYPFL